MSSTTVTTTTKPNIKTVNSSAKDEYSDEKLWTGSSTLITIRTAQIKTTGSLLKPSYTEKSAINKEPREGTVHLGRLGFENDEQALPVHGGPQKAVLQYNPSHYPDWQDQLKNITMKNESRRNVVLSLGGFGENIAVNNSGSGPSMDERTLCVGDLVGFGKLGNEKLHSPRMRISGPRLPCYKLNHRFGISNMSQRAQEQFWTGWFYSIENEGDVKVGDEIILLERPFPNWSVARVQHYLFKDIGNIDMIKEILATLGEVLVFDVKQVFENRLTKGIEDMSRRLKGVTEEEHFSQYRLVSKKAQTDRTTEFVFERGEKLSQNSKDFAVATPGSHVRLRLKQEGSTNTQLIRPYSIISGDSNTIRVGIALADHSRGGSTYLHKQIKIGDILEVGAKFANTFPLQSSEEVDTHVFLAGGIGITAFLDHMKYCVQHRQRFHLHYMIRNQSDYAFRDLIEEIISSAPDHNENDAKSEDKINTTSSRGSSLRNGHHNELAKVSVYISAEGGRCNVKSLLARIAKDFRTHIYVCGSEKLSDSVRADAGSLKIPEGRIHYEQFTLDASGDPFVAELTTSKREVKVKSDQSLLEALREAGLDIPSSCEAGNCATCKIRVKSGRILHKGTGLEDDEKAGYGGRDDGDMLSCVSRGVGTIKLEL